MEHTRLKSDNNVQYKASCVKKSKEEEFLIFHIFTFICLKTEEKARKNLRSMCCTANNVVLISLSACACVFVCVRVCVCVCDTWKNSCYYIYYKCYYFY